MRPRRRRGFRFSRCQVSNSKAHVLSYMRSRLCWSDSERDTRKTRLAENAMWTTSDIVGTSIAPAFVQSQSLLEVTLGIEKNLAEKRRARN